VVTHSIKQRPAALAYLAVKRRDNNLIWWLASCEPSELKTRRPATSLRRCDRSLMRSRSNTDPARTEGSGPVWFAGASGAPVLPDQGPDRPARHGKADQSLDPLHAIYGPAGLGRPTMAVDLRL
jgi:hypothetical protein